MRSNAWMALPGMHPAWPFCYATAGRGSPSIPAAGLQSTSFWRHLQCMVDEAELAGLSAKERELAIKRAKNREAARRWAWDGTGC